MLRLPTFLALCLFSSTLLLSDVAVAEDATTSSLRANSKDDDKLSLNTRLTLADNHTMPMIGLGVALAFNETYNAVTVALKTGYRLVDTAADDTYDNQDFVGQAVHDWLTKSNAVRENVFVTTKLWDDSHGFYPGIGALQASLKEFHHFDYVDLYLMHSPFGGLLIETWDAMLYLQKEGKVKSVGVSNFGIRHLQALEDSGRPLPVVNQIELHPLLYQRRLPLIQWCRERNITIQAYGSILAGDEESLQNPLLVKMTETYHKTSAQILLRWALQHGFAIIPKSTKEARIIENVQLFDFNLSQDDMTALDMWGHGLKHEDILFYKEDFNWNPVDEAMVHLGKTKDVNNTFWAQNFKDVDQEFVKEIMENGYPDSDSDEDEEEDGDDVWGPWDDAMIPVVGDDEAEGAEL